MIIGTAAKPKPLLGRPRQYPQLAELKGDDYLEVGRYSPALRNRINAAILYYRQTIEPDAKFSVRKVIKDGKPVLRVWRANYLNDVETH